jgi:OOP family OmpA-OmpF porin
MHGYSGLRGLLGLLALLVATHAGAQQQPSKWYAGASIGYGGYDTTFDRTNQSLFAIGATSFWVTADARETMWKVYVGYQVARHFSIEGGYYDFGKPSYRADVYAPASTTVQRNLEAHGWGADAVLWLPVSGGFWGFGKVGGIVARTRASATDPTAGLAGMSAESNQELNWMFGLGLEYRSANKIGGRIEFEHVRKIGDDAKYGTSDVLMFTAGGILRF